MTPGDPVWLAANDHYLAESLLWLRARLKARAPATAPPPRPAPAPPTVRPRAAPMPARQWYGLARAPTPQPATLVTVAAAPPAADPEEDEAPAARRRAEAAAMNPPPALHLLAERLGLTPFERDVLLLAAAPELEPAITEQYGRGDPGAAPAAPTFALALHVLDAPSWDALSPHRPLRHARLLELSQTGATPLTVAPLRVDERIVHYLKGLNALDDRLGGLLSPAGAGEAPPPLAPSQIAVAETIVRQLQAAGEAARVPLVGLIGADPGSQIDTARHVARVLGRDLHRLALDALPAAAADLDPLLRLWQRERLLLPIALFIDAHELAAAPADQQRALHALVRRDIGPAFIGLREPLGAAGDALAFDVAKPTAGEQRTAWLAAIEEDRAGDEPDPAPGAEAARLAGQFDLNLSDIGRANSLAALAAPDATPSEADRWHACRRLAQPRLDLLAERIEPRATWDDLVLADEATQLLRQIAAHARNRFKVYEDWGFAQRMTRGLGISALFAGESGTGKTMAAEVIANALRLGLYRIDLSAIVSKYIGETEKNLSRLFDAAEQGGAILLFDEADALFGKRSEVKDSHDRYANIEINYLLQRMEQFSGLAILATNMKSALDTAFLRRLRFVVNFPYPGLAERERMWRRALPPALKHDAIDYGRLARFALSGGNIHSVALNAAFLAAEREAPLSQGLLLAAVRTELRKLEKPVNEAEFR